MEGLTKFTEYFPSLYIGNEIAVNQPHEKSYFFVT